MSSEAEMKVILAKRREIGDFLHKHKEQLDRLRHEKQIPNSNWVIEFAENITMAAKAPKHWAAPRPLHEFRGHPPAPQFEQMRAGKLEAYHQKQLKKGGGSDTVIDSVLIPPLITFERVKPVPSQMGSNTRGRDVDAEDGEDTAAIAKRIKSSEDEVAASRQVEALKNSTSRKAAVNFGLEDSDSEESD